MNHDAADLPEARNALLERCYSFANSVPSSPHQTEAERLAAIQLEMALRVYNREAANRVDGDPQEYEIDILLDDCTQQEGLVLMHVIHNLIGDRGFVTLSATADLDRDLNV